MASFLVWAVQSAEEGGEVEGRGGGEGEGGKTAHGVAMSFLRSEAFQDMAELQELLLATCFERVAMALPRRYVYMYLYLYMF